MANLSLRDTTKQSRLGITGCNFDFPLSSQARLVVACASERPPAARKIAKHKQPIANAGDPLEAYIGSALTDAASRAIRKRYQSLHEVGSVQDSAETLQTRAAADISSTFAIVVNLCYITTRTLPSNTILSQTGWPALPSTAFSEFAFVSDTVQHSFMCNLEAPIGRKRNPWTDRERKKS